jgi:diketogulonate reductase-like aldo/keto reductase
LTGTRSEKHMREDLEIFAFTLTDPELAELTALF